MALTSTTPSFVDNAGALEALSTSLAGHDVIGLDTESDGFFRYRPKLCLLQIGAPGICAIVDPLAIKDLSPLWRVLSDASRTVILHDAEQDVTLLHRQYGTSLGRIFDTAHSARLLGMKQVGLAGLLAELFGVSLDKKEQRSDWARRPLTPRQLSYAGLDVAHLLALRETLLSRLHTSGRLPIAEQGFERIRSRIVAEKPADADAWRNLKGLRPLDPLGRGIAKAVFEFREALASRRDMAPFRVLGPDVIIEIALRRPMDVRALAGIRGVPPWLAHSPEALALVDAIATATPFVGPLMPPRTPESDADRIEAARFEMLRQWRAGAAAEMSIDVGLIVSNAQLKALARAAPNNPAELSSTVDLLPWQHERFAQTMLDVISRPVVPAPSKKAHRAVPASTGDSD